MLIISYQNFSSVNPTAWDNSHALKIMKEMNEFEKNNSDKKPTLATPQSGEDLKSVGNDWLQRQGSLLLNGYDKKLEAAMNAKLNSWFQDDSRNPAPQNNFQSADTTSDSSAEKPQQKGAKQSLRFSRVNSLKYEIGTNSCFDLTADPGNAHLNFSQILSSNTKLGLEHRTSDNKTQMMFKYEW